MGSELASCFDAQVWAKEFCKINTAIDEATMLGWFANAIMAGYDYAHREIKSKTEKILTAEVDENGFVRDCDGYPVGAYKPCIEKWKLAKPKMRAMTSVEIAKRYGKGGYAFRYSDKGYFHTVYHNTVSLQGICLIDDLCEDVSRSPWFMPMVDESGTVTEQRV
jgi:hypothetical protein